MIDRRFFLKSSGLALVGGTLLPNVFVNMANAATTKGNKTLVAIFQRGAVDGLNMIVPYGEQAYYAARPTIAVPRPGVEGGAIDLDGSLARAWEQMTAAGISRIGSTDLLR